MQLLFEWIFSVIDNFRFWQIIEPWMAGVRIRAGKFNSIITGGIWFKLPIFDKFYAYNAQRQVLNFPNQVVRTTDGKEFAVSAWCVYRIVSPEIPWLNVQDHDEGISVKGMDLLAAYINDSEEDEVTRDELIMAMTEELQIFSLLWGCEVEECGITDLGRTRIYRIISQDTPAII